MKTNTKKITTLAMLVAIGIALLALIRFPIMPAAPFLTFDFKDVPILIGGFLFGPAAALIMSVVLALVEMVTVSPTGIWGAVMNALSSSALTVTASFIYMHRRSISGAVIGLSSGVVVTTVVMLLWNFLIIPIYTGWPREAVVELMLPALLPFNLIKPAINATVTLLIYKHIAMALQVAKLLPAPSSTTTETTKKSGSYTKYVLPIAGFVLLTLVLIVLAINDFF